MPVVGSVRIGAGVRDYPDRVNCATQRTPCGRPSSGLEDLPFAYVLRRSAPVGLDEYCLPFRSQKASRKRVVRRPTIYHVVFFFVRVVFRSLLIAVFLHLAWG
jgi:hypothetical protein